jgi:ribosomal-protein-alanine N-acetyltransferase
MQVFDMDFCVPADVPELCSVESLCFENPWGPYVIAGDLQRGLLIYLKALCRSAVIGYGVLGRNEDVAHLLNLAVLPDFRRRGVARQIIAALEEIASEWECKRMRLEVRSSNVIARDFYSSIGFGYQARKRRYYANGEDALVFVARLPLSIG